MVEWKWQGLVLWWMELSNALLRQCCMDGDAVICDMMRAAGCGQRGRAGRPGEPVRNLFTRFFTQAIIKLDVSKQALFILPCDIEYLGWQYK